MNLYNCFVKISAVRKETQNMILVYSNKFPQKKMMLGILTRIPTKKNINKLGH